MHEKNIKRKKRRSSKRKRNSRRLGIILLLIIVVCFSIILYETVVSTNAVDYLATDSLHHNHSYHMQYEDIYAYKNQYTSINESLENSVPPLISSRKQNLFYVGIPGVFLFIELYPKDNFINVTKVPHTTLVLNNTYKLSQVFLMFGIEPFIDVVKKELYEDIDFYFVQSKYTFIDFIDAIGGVELMVDSAFAKHKHLQVGEQNISGSMTYDYISFVKPPDHLYKSKIITANQVYHTKRNERQIRTAKAIYEKFSYKNGIKIAISLLGSIKEDNIDSNIPQYELLKWIKNYNNPLISYHVLPGHYEKQQNQLVFFADTTGADVIKTRTFRLGKMKKRSFSY